MATAAENLNIIASVKSEIKGIIATDSNHLEAYPNKIAECIVDAPSVHSWADTRVTADGGTIKDGIAYVKALRGKSIKVNQQIKGKDATLLENTELSVKMTADGKVTITIPTANTSVRYIRLPSYGVAPLTTSGHKYYVSIIGAENTKEVSLYNDSCGVACSTTTPYAVGTATAEKALYLRIGKGENATATYTIYLQLVDLTQSGMDAVTTADGYAQMMGYATAKDLPYMAYNPDGIVLNCKQKSVKSYGRKVVQLVDSSKIPAITTSNGITFTNNGDGTMSVVGTATANAFISTWIPVVNGHKYLFASLTQNGSGTTFYAYLTGNVNGANEYARGIIYTANGTGNTYPVWCYVKSGASVNTKIIPVLLDLTEMGIDSLTTADAVAQYMGYADAASMPYIPYNDGTNIPTDTLTLPTLTAFPNGLCSNGATYDEVILSEGKAYKRIADDGTILDTPQEVTFTPCRAYYKASNNGQEVATADTATAPFTAEIGYKEPTATELANVLNA